MDFTLRPSLRHLSAFSIGLQIWKAKDFKELSQFTISRPFDRNYFVDKMTEVFSEKVSKLPLPNTSKNQVKHELMIIGFQVCKSYDKWIEFGSKPDFDIYSDYSNWTAKGTIDEWKVIKSTIDDEHVRHFESSTTGCKFCNLIFDSSSCDQNDGKNRGSYDAKSYDVMKWYWRDHNVCFRTEFPTILDITDGVPNICFERFNDQMSNSNGEYSGDCRFNWSNCMMDDERRIGLIAIFQLGPNKWLNVCCREIFFFLISNLTTQDQMEFFRLNTHVVLQEILKGFPRIELFTDAVHLTKDFITCRDHCSFLPLFETIAEIGNRAFAEVFECDKLFRALWIVSPDSLKRCVVGSRDVVLQLVCSMDARSINLMLLFANACEKRSIVSCIKDTIFVIRKNYPWRNWDSCAGFVTQLMFFNEDDIRDLKFRLSWLRHQWRT